MLGMLVNLLSYDEYAKTMSIYVTVFAYRKFKVNKDKEENSAMSTEILFSVDTDRCLPSLTTVNLRELPVFSFSYKHGGRSTL